MPANLSRRWLLAGVAAAAVVIVVAAVAFVAQALSPKASDNSGPEPTTPPTVSPTPTFVDHTACRTEEASIGGPVWETFDVLRREIDYSDVAGYRLVGYETTRCYQVAKISTEDWQRLVVITLYSARGAVFRQAADAPVEKRVEPYDPATGEPANPVGGTPAYWLPTATEAWMGEGLAWQWAPGAWATVVAVNGGPNPLPTTRGDQPTLRSKAYEIATRLRFGAGNPVTAPIAVHVPPCFRLLRTELSYTDPWSPPTVAVELATDATNDAPDPTFGGWRMGPTVVAAAIPFMTVDRTNPVHDGLAVRADLDGLRLYVYADPYEDAPPRNDHPASCGALPTSMDVYESLVIYPGGNYSEAQWGQPIVS